MRDDYDELLADKHTFKIRGETFTWREVKPEVLSAMGRALTKVNDDDDDAGWSAIDDQILLFLEPPDHEKWKALRAREENPITIKQINALLDDLIG